MRRVGVEKVCEYRARAVVVVAKDTRSYCHLSDARSPGKMRVYGSITSVIFKIVCAAAGKKQVA